jgi:hypothetical protein
MFGAPFQSATVLYSAVLPPSNVDKSTVHLPTLQIPLPSPKKKLFSLLNYDQERVFDTANNSITYVAPFSVVM